MGETCRFTGSLAHDTGIPATRTEADGEGFEPPRAFALRVFEARAFDQLSQPSMLFSIYPSWYHSPPINYLERFSRQRTKTSEPPRRTAESPER